MAESEHVASARAAYDATADLYTAHIGTEISAAIEAPLDRAVLDAFVELAAELADTGGLVADLGCGPGRVAALVAARGLDVIGIDLSAEMLEIAGAAHPDIRFAEGALAELPLATGSLSAAVCWYSIIHTPPDELGAIWQELRRVLGPGAALLVAFQAGHGEVVHRSDVLGRPVSITNYRHSPGDVAEALSAAGFQVTAQVLREPDPPRDSTQQAFLFARADTSSG